MEDKNKKNQESQQANYNPTGRNFDQEDVSGEPTPISRETKADEMDGETPERDSNTSRS